MTSKPKFNECTIQKTFSRKNLKKQSETVFKYVFLVESSCEDPINRFYVTLHAENKSRETRQAFRQALFSMWQPGRFLKYDKYTCENEQ